VKIRVDCYAGYRGEQMPKRFSFDARNVEVLELIDSWLAPDHRYFKVRGDDGVLYILRHDTASDDWMLTLMDRRG
jgi:hypothetical protein